MKLYSYFYTETKVATHRQAQTGSNSDERALVKRGVVASLSETALGATLASGRAAPHFIGGTLYDTQCSRIMWP